MRTPIVNWQTATTTALRIAMGCASFLACSGEKPSDEPVSASLAQGSYHTDVAPLLREKCVGCHTEGGNAPFALTTYASVFERRNLIREAVIERRMPPWPYPLDESCADYGPEPSLSRAEIESLVRWIDGGAAEGPYVAPAPRAAPYRIRVDAAVTPPEPYTPRFDPGRFDDYRCFVVDWPSERARHVTGFRVTPGVPYEVHHAIAFLINPGSEKEYLARDAEDPEPGYPCFGAPGGGNFSSLGSWSPGADGDVPYPAGTGIRVEPGSKLVIQMHYNAHGGPPAPDRTSFEFQLDDDVRPGLFLMHADPMWIIRGMPIEAGDPNARVHYEVDLSNGEPFTLYNAGVHMHLLGKRAQLAVQRSDGTRQCLVDSSWNFQHQRGFAFREPKVVQPGDKLVSAA